MPLIRVAAAMTAPRVGLVMLVLTLAAVSVGVLAPPAVVEPFFGSRGFLIAGSALAALIGLSVYLRLGDHLTVGRCGSVALHASVLLLVAGAGWDRAAGWVRPIKVFEGSSVAVTADGVYRLRLDRLHPWTREGRWVTGDGADVALIAPGVTPDPVRVRANRPLSAGPLTLHLLQHGFAPIIEIDGVARLVPLETTLAPSPRYWARLVLPDGGPDVALSFRPAPAGPFLRAPELTVVDAAGRSGAVRLRPGRPVRFAGRTLALGPVRYWATFSAGWQPGRRLIFAAFALAVLGAVLALRGEVADDRG